MAEQPFDRIYIRDLGVRCIVGLYPEERRAKQDVILNIVLHADLRAAGLSDDINDTIDYKRVKKSVLRMAEASQFLLVERLAQAVADCCFESPGVQKVEVTVDKPGALRFARSVAVHITRERPPHG